MIDFLLGLFVLIAGVACTSSVLRLAKTLLSKCLRSDLYTPFSGSISAFIATAVSVLFVICRVFGILSLLGCIHAHDSAR